MKIAIDQLVAPAMITWQLTRDCNLACLHCCTDSAPGKALKDELSRQEALAIAGQIIELGVPKVMICGGEPTIVGHFHELARKLGEAGTLIKIETNGQNFGPADVEKLKDLPIFSIQISLDGDTQEIYAKQRPGGKLDAAHAACRAVTDAGLPLEVTFAPTRINIHEAESVIDRAARFRAFRFNTGKLMRLGTASKLWDKLEPTREQCGVFLNTLRRKQSDPAGRMEILFEPWEIEAEVKSQLSNPPATVLMLPNGRIKISAALPHLCADLRRDSLAEAWEKYCNAWGMEAVRRAIREAAARPELLSDANHWVDLAAIEAPDMAPAEGVHGRN